ncbi:MAG: hypothetical protein U0457_10895 [Candidatus Sericytochromatia bacterium]
MPPYPLKPQSGALRSSLVIIKYFLFGFTSLIILNFQKAYALPENIEITYDTKVYPQLKENITETNLLEILKDHGFYGQKEVYSTIKNKIKITTLGNDNTRNYIIIDKDKNIFYSFNGFLDKYNDFGMEYKNLTKDTKVFDFAIENIYDYEMFENNKKLYNFLKNIKHKKIYTEKFKGYDCEVFNIERIKIYPKTEYFSESKYIDKINIWFSKKLNFPLKIENIRYEYDDNVFKESLVRIKEMIKIDFNKKFAKNYFDIKAKDLEKLDAQEYEKELNSQFLEKKVIFVTE